ncbi:hypothetical protein [Variovorax sp. N23]|jgi:hypothetical protein|uniref:hypothetical protein n=1 Tax=Variovorax sp. N23 TaxID=2980555 RepID=UPI0021C67272|nr:hypothetical protein [Variovorax sp. N23]MCU4118661.1 hypothetical protein [Variovorax sp. N23]
MTKLFLYALSMGVSVALVRYVGPAALLAVFALCGCTFLFSTGAVCEPSEADSDHGFA